MITHCERKMIYMMIVPRRNSFDLFDDFFKDDHFFDKKVNHLMKTDIKQKGDKYLVEVDLPGFEKENINIELKDGYLVISAHSESEQEDNETKYIHKEKFYGECSRSFYIGDDINKEDITAEFKNGILIVTVPKKDEKQEETSRKIEIM